MNRLFLLIAVVLLNFQSCTNAQTNQTAQTSVAKVKVYFFHGTHRCAGCINAEKAAVDVLNKLYKTELDKGIITFESINFEEDKNKALADKYQVAMNMLLIVKNDNSGQKTDLTDKAFSNSNNVDELGKYVKPVIDKMIN